MKFKICSLGLLSLASLLPLIPILTPEVNACAIVDATTQVDIYGTQPGVQENNVNTGHDGNCLGNAAVGTTTQVGIGQEGTDQTNQSNYYVGGGEYNDTGLTSPYIEVTPQTQIQLHSPAHDPGLVNPY
ncbi:MAG: hypothetical protein ACFCU5_19710 [Pleurocapsa sp.]